MVPARVGAAVNAPGSRMLRQRAQDITHELIHKHGVPASMLEELVGIERLLATNTTSAAFDRILRNQPEEAKAA